MDQTLAHALLAKAIEKYGGDRELAERLRVPAELLLTYRNGLARMPDRIAMRLIDLISDRPPA